jgi:class 3 adenylate cyclase/predicted ATPase
LEQGDRRQLTVLFCDVVGSSRILETLDEEDWSYLLREYHASCQHVIEHYGGYVAQYLGDGVLAYFGYPVAHENNAHRAIKAALEIIAQLDSMNQRVRLAIEPKQATLRVRIAIHTGLTVVANLAHGIVPVIASRLQQKAVENTVVISESTYRLVEGAFACYKLGSLHLENISSPQLAYQVMGESGLQSRFEVGVSRGLTGFVGRHEELARLDDIWREVLGGSGRVVLIHGDPGIGKSRLVEEFTARLGGSSLRALACQCSQYNNNSAYYAVINLILSLLGVRPTDGDDIKLERIEASIARIGIGADEAVPIIARLLSLSCGDRYKEANLSAAQEKQKLQDLLVAWLHQEAAITPIRLFVEDLHWVDRSSQELLDRLVATVADSRILLLVSLRNDVPLPWQDVAHVRRITLGALGEQAAQAMVRNLQGNQTLAADVIRRLVAHTDGVPLFLEESTLLVLSQEGYDQDGIPASLQDLLMARLDRLGAAKELAQYAATIGHEFSHALLRAVALYDEPRLLANVDQLMGAGLVRRHEDTGAPHYSFKHALIRDTAYRSLLTRTRKLIHRCIADAFVEKFPDIGRNQPELVAHHYTEAGQTQQAVDYWQKAGLRSAERYESSEVIAHLKKGLQLLATLPNTPGRLRQELELQAVLAGRLIATQGYGAAGVETVYQRALELARELRDTPRSLQMTLGLQSFHFTRSNFQMAHRLADECLALARQVSDPARVLNVHWVLGEIFFHQGDHALCEAHLSECMNNYQKSYHRPRMLQDPAVMSLSYCSWTHWMLGFPERALETVTRAIDLAEELAHPFSKSVAYSFAAGLHLFRGEFTAARRLAERAIELCTEHGFPVWLAFCTVVQGRARVEDGDVSAGIEDMERGIALWEGSGSVVTTPYYKTLLAEGYAAAGQPELGLKQLEEALSMVDRTGERYYEAEICRVRGELLLQARGAQHAQADAEAYFTRAVDVAGRQTVRSLELRAVMSLTRLQMATQPGELLRKRLGAIYHGFTEGTNTADLMEARQLLGEFV